MEMKVSEQDLERLEDEEEVRYLWLTDSFVSEEQYELLHEIMEIRAERAKREVIGK